MGLLLVVIQSWVLELILDTALEHLLLMLLWQLLLDNLCLNVLRNNRLSGLLSICMVELLLLLRPLLVIEGSNAEGVLCRLRGLGNTELADAWPCL